MRHISFVFYLTSAVRRTDEAREGALAFLEKRQPSYAVR